MKFKKKKKKKKEPISFLHVFGRPFEVLSLRKERENVGMKR